MRRFVWAALLALPLTALAGQRAEANGGLCWDVQGGFRLKICAAGFLKICPEPFSMCNPCHGGGGGGPSAPWHSYWPMGAHQQAPMPMPYPYWPAAMVPATAQGAGFAPYQGAGYYAAPSYWYGQ